jgi:hypothetical protein
VKKKNKKTTFHKVAIVLDKNFGEKVAKLSQKMHVWLCDTPVNKKAAAFCWLKENKFTSLENGITTFKISNQDSPESILTDIIVTVDLHHGEYSHNPPWSELHVYGIRLIAKIESKLREFGTGRFESIANGFIFYRQL